MNTVQKPGMPMLGDGYDHDGMVAVAWNALDAFGADTLTRPRARRLLDMWRYRSELSAEQLSAVLRRFPEPAPLDVPAHHGYQIGQRHGGQS